METMQKSEARITTASRGGPKRFAAYQFFVADTLFLVLEAAIYLASLALPLLLFWHLGRGRGPVGTLLLGAGAWLISLLCFVTLIVGLRRLLGTIPAGRFMLSSPRAARWIIADKLAKIFYRSPFAKLVSSVAPLRYLYLRGMGAKIKGTLVLGPETKILEPWLLSAGENVLIGDGAAISGHKVERHVLTLEPVEIEDDVLVGTRAIIFPGVRIGKGAVVGANSVVVRGSVIAAGETWSGNPARKQTLFKE